MSKQRSEYIDQLLNNLKLLEQHLLSIKESDTLPFSFFSVSFDRIERISRSLHELELMQIGEMKEQMEHLVRILSKSESRNSTEGEPELKDQQHCPDSQEHSGILVDSTDVIDESLTKKENGLTKKITLPEYRDPRVSIEVPPFIRTDEPLLEEKVEISQAKSKEEIPATRSLNDIIQAPPALLDLKRGISLNDRFLFQRELFNNNRSEMDRVMEILNGLVSFEEAENYLKKELSWDFENQTVKEFLIVIKKGFE